MDFRNPGIIEHVAAVLFIFGGIYLPSAILGWIGEAIERIVKGK